MDEDLLTTSRVDHLPMVAQMIEDIGMIEFIDSQTYTARGHRLRFYK